jgi:hypothetical protein
MNKLIDALKYLRCIKSIDRKISSSKGSGTRSQRYES